MKVYLINPPAPEKYIREGRCMQKSGVWATLWPPHSLALCAAVLEHEKCLVKLTDCSAEDLDLPRLLAKVGEFQPDLVVTSTATPSIDYDLMSLEALRRAFPALKTAAFGTHVSALPDDIFAACPSLDFIIRGEPEYTLRDLVSALNRGMTAEGIHGLSHRKGVEIIHEPERPWIENLDEMPFPAWHLITTGLYTLPLSGRPFLTVFSARGCPYGCIFCADQIYYGKKMRTRTASRIVDEIEYDIKRFDVKDFLFWTESFTNRRELVLEIVEELRRRNLTIHWYCNSRVDNVDRELLQAMKASGCEKISFGIESFSAAVLKKIMKGTTPDQAIDALKLAHSCGLEVIAHCILGLPGDTLESMEETVRQICALPVDYAQFYAAAPFPGTELYAQALENRWIGEDCKDWKNFEQGSHILEINGLSPCAVNEARNRAFQRFYFRPHILWRVFCSLLKEGKPSMLLKLWKEFLVWTKSRRS
jgi:anaerobic magnesium-protoporphyrin IX monomethyl ester cyclase